MIDARRHEPFINIALNGAPARVSMPCQRKSRAMLPLIVLTIVASCTGVQPRPVSSPTLVAEHVASISAVAAAFSRLYVRGDAQGMAALYTEDAAIFPSGRPIIRGRAAIATYWTLAPNVKVVEHKTTADSVIIVGNTAYDYGTFRSVTARDGQSGSPGYGKYVIVWRRLPDGRWLIHLDIWNPSPSPQAPGSTDVSPLDQMLSAAVGDRTVATAIGLVARGDTVFFQRAVGQIEPGVPATTDLIVRLASMTKPLTATAVMLLAEEGKLRLTDRVDTWFPGFGATVSVGGAVMPAQTAITIHHLLTHQAGLATSGPAYDSLFNVATADEFARRIGRIPLRFQPGARYEYGCCGSAYEVLGAIVERVSNQSLAAFMEQRVFRPLGMVDTYFRVPEAKLTRLAPQVRKDQSGSFVPFRKRGQEDLPTSFFSGAGGVRSTVADYHRFARDLLNGGELDGVRLLRSESVRAMMTNHVGSTFPTQGYGWGYGLRVRTSGDASGESAGAVGWGGGTGTLFVADPARKLVVIIFAPTNVGTPGVNAFKDAFIAAAYAAARLR
jgi:CubicO group peptidase (beta-lactamase class C family)